MEDNVLASAGGVGFGVAVGQGQGDLGEVAPDDVLGEQHLLVAALLNHMREVATVAEFHNNVQHGGFLVEEALVVAHNVVVGWHTLKD